MPPPKKKLGPKWLVKIRVVNWKNFHFPVSKGNNQVDNRIANNSKIIG